MTTIKFKKLHPNATIPQAATPFAGAMDVTCTEVIQEDGYVRCMVGFSTEIPEGYRVICAARSSITKTGWMLANGIGIVDSDYRNEWEFRFVPIPKYKDDFSIGNDGYGGGLYVNSYENYSFPYNVGDRIGQIFLEKIEPIQFEVVEELSKTDRKGGFGSTGN